MPDDVRVRTVMVGMDESDSARAALRQVFDVFAGRPRPRLVLVHVLVQRVPPHLEYVDPSMVWDTAGLGPVLGDEDREIINKQKADAAERMRAVFDSIPHDWPADRFDIQIVEGGFSRATIAEILTYQAREEKADIIVVGRTTHGAFHDAFIKSTAARLVRACKATTIWVVGTSPDDHDCDECVSPDSSLQKTSRGAPGCARPDCVNSWVWRPGEWWVSCWATVVAF
jgi:nucleotide-binding universal stress UspA family protein